MGLKHISFVEPITWPRTRLQIREIHAADGFTLRPTPRGVLVTSDMGEAILVDWSNVISSIRPAASSARDPGRVKIVESQGDQLRPSRRSAQP